jgi:hypothetical protein
LAKATTVVFMVQVMVAAVVLEEQPELMEKQVFLHPQMAQFTAAFMVAVVADQELLLVVDRVVTVQLELFGDKAELSQQQIQETYNANAC